MSTAGDALNSLARAGWKDQQRYNVVLQQSLYGLGRKLNAISFRRFFFRCGGCE